MPERRLFLSMVSLLLIAALLGSCKPKFRGPIPPSLRSTGCVTISWPEKTYVVDFAAAKIHDAVRGHNAAVSRDGRWFVYAPLPPREKFIDKNPVRDRPSKLILLDRTTSATREVRLPDGEYFSGRAAWIPAARAFALGVSHRSEERQEAQGPYVTVCSVDTAELRRLPQRDVTLETVGPDGATILLREPTHPIHPTVTYRLVEVTPKGEETAQYAIGPFESVFRRFADFFGNDAGARGFVLHRSRKKIVFSCNLNETWVYDLATKKARRLEPVRCRHRPIGWVTDQELLAREYTQIVIIRLDGTHSTVVK